MKKESRKPVSILLPTKNHTDVIGELLDQISDRDELIVICDSENDPIADNGEKEFKLIIAGEPEGCSGKANAIYEGMKAADHDRILWTDDDFHHPEGWLDKLCNEYDRYGAVSELPFFIGKNPLSILFEPVYSLVMFITYIENQSWGGAVMFDRTLLDEEKFLSELHSTIGDDVLLSEHLEAKTLRRTRRVEIDNSIRESLERITRFLKHVRYHAPLKTAFLGAGSVFITAALILYPLELFAIFSLFFMVLYRFLGEYRPSFFLGYFSLLFLPFFLIYGLSRKSFLWQGRRYKYNSKLDVEILDG